MLFNLAGRNLRKDLRRIEGVGISVMKLFLLINLQKFHRPFEGAPDFVRSFDADERTMTKYIIGAVSALDRPMTPSVYGKYSLSAYMTGLTEETALLERKQLLDCTPEDIRALAGIIEAFLSEEALCVVGNAEKLQNEAARFDKLEKLQ